MIEFGLTEEEITCNNSQDGIDRFGIKGIYTAKKHQTMQDYTQINPNFSKLPVHAFMREPFERLVSLYFSPHRWVKATPNGQRIHFKDIYFSEDEFISLATQSLAGWEFLTTIQGEFASPERLETYDYENFDDEINRLFSIATSKLSPPWLNKSPFKECSAKVLTSKHLQDYVHQSKHGIDLKIMKDRAI